MIRTLGGRRSRITLTLAALTLVASGCGASSNDEHAKGAAQATDAPNVGQFIGKPSADQCAGGKYNLGFDVFSDSQSFALATRKGIEAVAKEMGCVNVETLSDGADPAKAVENVNIFVQTQKDGVMLAQVIEAAQAGIVKVLNQAQIEGVASYVPAPGIPFIDVDNTKAGEKAGTALGELAQERWAGATPYLLIGSFQEGGPLSIKRMEGYATGLRSVMADFPEDNIIDIPTKADPPTANTNTANALSRIPEGSKLLVGGINDENTLAMTQAIKNSKRGYEVIAIGQGASVLDAICSGDLYGSVGYFPENYGKYTIPAVIGMIQGQTVPDFIELPTELLTKDNLGKYYPEKACN